MLGVQDPLLRKCIPKGKRQKLVVEPFDHEKVHLLKHGQSRCMDGKSFPDSRLNRAGTGHEGAGSGGLLLGFEETPEQLPVGARAASIVPSYGVRLGATGTPGQPRGCSGGKGVLQC